MPLGDTALIGNALYPPPGDFGKRPVAPNTRIAGATAHWGARHPPMALALADLRFKSTPLSSDHWRENLAGADTSDSELVKWTIRGGLINGLRIDERGAFAKLTSIS